MDEMNPVSSKCMIMKGAACNGKDCSTCGFSWKENERRKKLPLVELDNGLYGKRVGRKQRAEE